jgi:hypothetical protein
MSEHQENAQGSASPVPALPPAHERRWVWAGATLIVLAGLAAYSNSFSGPFIFDDIPAIVENPTIRSLRPIRRVLCPPSGGVAVEGRPVVNLSLAVNYALGGTNVWGYHVFNLAVHLLAAGILPDVRAGMLRLPPHCLPAPAAGSIL